jgi:uncharacterized membrane-anchored protein
MPAKRATSNGTSAPNATVGVIAAGTFSGALVTVGIWIAKTFYSVDVPAEIAAPLTTLVGGIGSAIYAVGRFLINKLSL